MICIYQIRNLTNGKIYVGSTKNFKKRRISHLQHMRQKKHHNIHLQRSYDKHGSKAFVFECLEECTEKNLFEKEQFWIDKLNPEYNIGGVGGGDNFTNHPNKKQIKKKLLKGLERARKAPKKSIEKDQNPNWKGGKTFFTCPMCGKETRTTVVNIPKTCADCRDRTGNKNPFYKKVHSKKTRELLSKQRLGIPNLHSSKPCSINGQKFVSCSAASKALDMKSSTVSKRLKSKTERFKDWYYLDED